MKKTLAILLALLAAASVTMASCSNNKKTPIDNGGSNDNYYEDTDDDSESESISNGGSESESNGTGTDNYYDPTTGYEDKNDTVYAGVGLNLRTSPSTGSNSNVKRTVPFGTKLNRKQSNGTWDKVTVDGDSTEYYVLHEWTVGSNANFSFEDCEDANVTFSTKEDVAGVQFYLSPFVHEDLSVAVSNAYLKTAIKAADIEGEYTLTRTEMNSNWVKVTFVGKVKNGEAFTAEAPGVFYIQSIHFTNGRLVDTTFPSSGNSGNTPGGLG